MFWLVFLTHTAYMHMGRQSGKSMIDASEFEYEGGLHIVNY